MPITLFIGEGWNPLVTDEDDWDELDEDGGEPRESLDGIDIAASAARARERFLAVLRAELPEGLELRIAPAAEGEGALWDDDFTEAEEDFVADALLGGCGASSMALVMNLGDAIQILRDTALEDRSAWVVME